MTVPEVLAAYYLGCFVFALNGLLFLAHRQEVIRHRHAAQRAERLLTKHLRKSGTRK